ncbi:MAG: hypothetical protein PHV32_14590, partial [Eubacteriales bacterium]|nr:hypothetical protein [Eubacteriales bacterium]
MKVNAVKTGIVEVGACSLKEFISESITELKENTVVAITSKVVAICEGSAVPQDGMDKGSLIESESDYFLPKSENKYNVYLTIKNNMLIPSSGVDESNANGYYIKWPSNPQASAVEVWEFLRERFGLKNIG